MAAYRQRFDIRKKDVVRSVLTNLIFLADKHVVSLSDLPGLEDRSGKKVESLDFVGLIEDGGQMEVLLRYPSG